MTLKVDVGMGGYPVWITLTDGDTRIRLAHSWLIELEQAIQCAKRDVLCALPREKWHELSAEFAANGK